MASGGKRSAGERVLEGKHVIVLFLLMLLFSGLFFTLGYVMGRNQYDVPRVAQDNFVRPEPAVLPKAEPIPKKAPLTRPGESESDPATSSNSDWEFYNNSKPPKTEPRLEPPPKASSTPPTARPVSAKTAVAPAKTILNSPVQDGALMLQVAACLHRDDALAVAGSLQKKHYAVVVLNPQKDKYYRVQVGPLKDQKTGDATKKDLENAGFNAFYVKH